MAMRRVGVALKGHRSIRQIRIQAEERTIAALASGPQSLTEAAQRAGVAQSTLKTYADANSLPIPDGSNNARTPEARQKATHTRRTRTKAQWDAFFQSLPPNLSVNETARLAHKGQDVTKREAKARGYIFAPTHTQPWNKGWQPPKEAAQ